MQPDGKQLVLDGVDIADVVGRSVKLKPRGREMVGLCPFHDEKTPSFYVIPHKRMFHCFGCRAGGNVIDFVMQRDRLEFGPALRLLAEQHNIELPKLGKGDNGRSDRRQQLYDACAAAAGWFQKQLRSDDGQAAREYLKGRGFTGEIARDFGLGFAPDSFDAFQTDAALKKFPIDVLVEADLVKPNDRGGFFASFRDRVMFPIRDEQGRTIAFGGRVLPGGKHPAKYLNSKETPLFHKSRVAFGLDRAKDAILKAKTVVVVEGYTDVVKCHQHGAQNVVSVLGTALTAEHVKLLGRFADKVVLLFDADAAGAGAAQRSVELFLTQDIEIAIATLPPGQDPDEFVTEHGADGFASLADAAENPLDYHWHKVARGGGSVTDRQTAVEKYLELLVRASLGRSVKPERLQNVLAQVAYHTKIDLADLRPRLRQIAVELKREQGHRPAEPDQPVAEPEAFLPPPANRTAEERAQCELLSLLLEAPDRWSAVQETVAPDNFGPDAAPLRRIAERYWDHQRHEGEPELAEWVPTIDADLRPLVMTLVREGLNRGRRGNDADESDDLDARLRGSLEFFTRRRDRQRERELIGSAGRSTREVDDLDADAARLRALAESASKEDLARGRF
jgi:DNA primase